MKEVKIAIAGLGVVGGEVARILCDEADRLSWQAGAKLNLVAVSAREERDRGFSMDGIAFERDAASLANRDDIDIVVELIGGSDGVAFALCQRALNTGKHVVTANKAMVAHHGHDLAICAEENDAQLCFEAAVAGGFPAI
jgi:homoserine dehydrogenase